MKHWAVRRRLSRMRFHVLLASAALLLFIPRFGLCGAAMAAAAAMMAEAALLNVAVRRNLGITLSAFASPKAADAFGRIQRP